MPKLRLCDSAHRRSCDDLRFIALRRNRRSGIFGLEISPLSCDSNLPLFLPHCDATRRPLIKGVAVVAAVAVSVARHGLVGLWISKAPTTTRHPAA
jgi:hypothetical protein